MLLKFCNKIFCIEPKAYGVGVKSFVGKKFGIVGDELYAVDMYKAVFFRNVYKHLAAFLKASHRLFLYLSPKGRDIKELFAFASVFICYCTKKIGSVIF